MKISELITKLEALGVSIGTIDTSVWIGGEDGILYEVGSIDAADFGRVALITIGKKTEL